MNPRHVPAAIAAAITLLVAAVTPAPAASIRSWQFDYSNGANLAARAAFDLTTAGPGAGTLTVTLTNTAPVAATHNPHVLTAIFWDSPLAGSAFGAFTSVTAAGSTYLPLGSTGSAEGSFVYSPTVSGAPHDNSFAISAVGFGLDYGAGRKYLNLDGSPGSPSGLGGGNGGLVPDANGNNVYQINRAVIRDHLTFTFTGASTALSESAFTHFVFQYGTSFSELTTDPITGVPITAGTPIAIVPAPTVPIPAVPAPASFATGGALMLALALTKRRRAQRPESI